MKVKKLISCIVTLVMIFSLMPTVALGQSDNWSDYTEAVTPVGDTYSVSTPEELAWVAKEVNGGNDFAGKTIRLTADIVLSGNRVWTPIGERLFFKGIFDGNGHTIASVYIEDCEGSAQGLFGYVHRDGIVKNLGVIRARVFCETGSVVVGGLVGYNDGTVTNCYTDGTVQGNNLVLIGGLVGQNSGTVTNCHTMANVSSGNGSAAGGLVGSNFGNIQNCVALCNIVKNSSIDNKIGRIAGANTGTCTNVYGLDTMILETQSTSNGFSGEDVTSQQAHTASWWTSTAAFTGSPWSFKNAFLPKIGNFQPYDLLGAGTEEAPYEIYNEGELLQMAGQINGDRSYSDYYDKHYKLMNDIKLTKNWFPIGYYNDHPFRGSFDGGGYTVSGMLITENVLNYYGFFGKTKGHSNACVIKNLTVKGDIRLEDKEFTGDINIGGIGGEGTETHFENCRSEVNISVKNSSVSDIFAGGIVGSIRGAELDTIVDCANAGNITIAAADSEHTKVSVGGLAGSVKDDSIYNSYNVGNLSATAAENVSLGGLAGSVNMHNTVNIINSYNGGTLTGGSTKGAVRKGAVVGDIYTYDPEIRYDAYSTFECDAIGGSNLESFPVKTESQFATETNLTTLRNKLQTWVDQQNDQETPGAYAGESLDGFNDWYINPTVDKGRPCFTEYTAKPTSDSGSSATYYTITVNAGKGGTAATDNSLSVKSGDNRTFTIIPDTGFKIADVLVDGVSVGAIYSYQFNNVQANHTLEVNFEPLFQDVLENAWFYDDIMYVFAKGIMTGTDKETFEPDTIINRGMMVTILYRLEGEPDVSGLQNPFNDVEGDTWYTKAVKWGAENVIIKGYSADRYAPEEPITREQMTAILHRYSQYKSWDVSDSDSLVAFTDAGSISEYALPSIKWAVAEKLMNGRTETTLAPQGDTTRAEAASLLHRFMTTIVK